jgi:DNA-binding transcriptional ArsR family regulator
VRKELRSTTGTPLKSLGAIVGHPLRAKIWTVLAEEVASPNELSRRFREEIANVSYHVKVLRENDVIELVNRRQVRGAVEHFYRATQRPLSDEADTASRSLENRNGFADHVLRTFFADAVLSLGDGIFGERPDHCVARVPLLADEEGWRKLALMYDELIHRTLEIQAESTERLAPDDPRIKVTAFAALFERTFPSKDSPPRPGNKGGLRTTSYRAGSERGALKSLGAIVGHPLRAKIWTVLAEEVASPNELSRRLGEEIADVSYHVKVLRNNDVIELVNTRQVRGAVEHFYRAIQRPLSDEADTAARSVENRNAFADHILRTFFADAVLSLGDGIFGERPDHCVARVPLLVDEQGWRKLALMYEEVVHRTVEVQAECAERLAGEPGIRATAFAALFERTSPSGDSPQQPEKTKRVRPTSRRAGGERG